VTQTINNLLKHAITYSMNFHVELEQETDGRWIAEIPELPGVSVCGDTRDHATQKAQGLALRVLADGLSIHKKIS
jgi:predicted RNase H-like HicB family nuclease